jgi:hypothetical protein
VDEDFTLKNIITLSRVIQLFSMVFDANVILAGKMKKTIGELDLGIKEVVCINGILLDFRYRLY